MKTRTKDTWTSISTIDNVASSAPRDNSQARVAAWDRIPATTANDDRSLTVLHCSCALLPQTLPNSFFHAAWTTTHLSRCSHTDATFESFSCEYFYCLASVLVCHGLLPSCFSRGVCVVCFALVWNASKENLQKINTTLHFCAPHVFDHRRGSPRALHLLARSFFMYSQIQSNYTARIFV